MYATAHRVTSPAGEEGINAFLHKHGNHFPWPAEPWTLPESSPGDLVAERVAVRRGGNHVRAYLDLIAPDSTSGAEIDIALTGLWLGLVADEMGPHAGPGALPNPVIFQRGQVVLRFGVELGMSRARALQMAELRRAVDPATAVWDDAPRRSA